MKKYEEIFQLLMSNHIIFKNGKLENTGKYKGVNASSGCYFSNEYVDEKLKDWKNINVRKFLKGFYKEKRINDFSFRYWIKHFKEKNIIAL